MVNAVEPNGDEVCFVLLKADKKEIEKRVVNESRLKYTKANSVEKLRGFWEMHDLFSPVNNYESLIIDNTKSSAKETAKRIIDIFSLSSKKKFDTTKFFALQFLSNSNRAN